MSKEQPPSASPAKGSRRRWLSVLLLAAVAVAGWRAWDWWSATHAGTTELLFNRVWLERMPRAEREMVRNLALVQHGERKMGVTARASRWRVQADLFRWRMDGEDRLETRFPQDGRQATFNVRAWYCAKEAPKPFELCLELSRGGRTRRLYSREDWIIRSDGEGARADREIGWLAPTWDLEALPPSHALGESTTEAASDFFPFD